MAKRKARERILNNKLIDGNQKGGLKHCNKVS